MADAVLVDVHQFVQRVQRRVTGAAYVRGSDRLNSFDGVTDIVADPLLGKWFTFPARPLLFGLADRECHLLGFAVSQGSAWQRRWRDRAPHGGWSG